MFEVSDIGLPAGDRNKRRGKPSLKRGMWISSRIRSCEARGSPLPDKSEVLDERLGELHLLPQDARPVRPLTDQ